MIKYFIAGIVTKLLASFDDTVTRIPVIAQVTYTRKGKIAFCFGNLLAVTVAIVAAWLFSAALSTFPYTREITAALILILAGAVYLDFFNKKDEEKVKKEEEKIKKKMSYARFWHLVLIGFLVSGVTLLDDFIVLTPLFMSSLREQWSAMVGIYLATLGQFMVMIYLANKVAKLKYLKEVASSGLFVLAIIVYFGLL